MRKNLVVSMVFLIGIMFLVQCSSSMKIQSVPEGADVYINKEKKGVTPYVYTDKKPLWSELNIELKKEGYEQFNVTVRKVDGDVNYGAGCAGCFVYLPWLWLFDYPAEKKYELEKK